MIPTKWFLLGWFGLLIFANVAIVIFLAVMFGSLRRALFGHDDVSGFFSLSIMLADLICALPPLIVLATIKVARRGTN